MSDLLLHVASAFGLGVAAGSNVFLPLTIVAVFARAGYITLAGPFQALTSDVALWGLLVLAILELAADKIEGLDSLTHTITFPLAVAAAAVLAGSQSGAIAEVHPGLAILVGLLTSGTVAGVTHTVRATLRPVTHLAMVGRPISLAEDMVATALTTSAIFAPWMVPVILLGLALAAYVFFRILIRVGRSFWKMIQQVIRTRFGGAAAPGITGAGPGSDDDLDWLDGATTQGTGDRPQAEPPQDAPGSPLRRGLARWLGRAGRTARKARDGGGDDDLGWLGEPPGGTGGKAA